MTATRYPIFLLICLPLWLGAQYDLAIGDWKSYLPYGFANHVTQSPSRVYFAVDQSLAVYDKADLSFQTFSKVEGLSSVGIAVVKYVSGANILVVVYQDGRIDLVKENSVTSLFDIPNFQGITGDKEVYDIYAPSDSALYFSGNFGLSKFNLTAEEFAFTTFTNNVPVAGSAVLNDYLYMATEEGVYRISLDNTFIEDFNQWEFLGAAAGFPDTYASSAIVLYKDRIYLDVNDSLYRFDGNQGSFVHFEPDMGIRYLTAEGPRLIAGFYCLTNCPGKVLYFQEDNTFLPAPSICVDRPLYGVEDADGNVWFADNFREFRYHLAGNADGGRLKINSPFTQNIYEMKTHKEELWVATGGVRTDYSYLFRDDGIFGRQFGTWFTYNRNSVPELEGLFDFIDIIIHPETDKVFAASYLDGLVTYDRNAFMVYNDTNSTLGNAQGDETRTKVSGLAFDAEYNVWIANHLADRPVSVFRADSSWQSFKPSCGENQLLQVAVDPFGNKWFVVGNNNAGLMVFNEGDPTTTIDDECRLITTNNSNLPSNRVNCIQIDQDGAVWVGTEQGVIVFECGTAVFDPSICFGNLPFVEQDNFGANLLETENVRTIAIDGGNRKWFGTDNGIFVQSPNGREQVAYFNVDNSPLFDNVINDIVIQPQTGEVFIGTNRGLQSVRGEATEGGEIHSAAVAVFPNPVRPEYDGVIAISGLARDADVRITDVSGQLVYQTRALGGQAIWDGRDYNGRKAQTGVYLVYCTSISNFEAPDTAVAKILFIN